MTAHDVVLSPLAGKPRRLREWMTTFPLAPVVLDPYTHESAWILDTAHRVLSAYQGAGVRPCWLVTAPADDVRRFLGPYADDFITFADPDRVAVKGLGISAAPAFLLIRQDCLVVAVAEGWDPESWRSVTDALDDMTRWNRPQLPAPGDPAAFSGTPIGP